MGRTDDPVFVGCDEELQCLTEWANEALSGQAGIVLIRGQSGIGKTSLVGKLCDRLREEYPDIVVATAQGKPERTSYCLFRDVIDNLLTTHGTQALVPEDSAGAVTVGDIVNEAIQYPGSEAMSIFFPSRAANIIKQQRRASRSEEDTQEFQSIPDLQEMSQLRMFGWYTQIIKALAAQCPLAVFLDDLHLADLSSLHLLRYLAREVLFCGHETHNVRLLIIGTYHLEHVPYGSWLTHLKQTLSHLLPIRIHHTHESSPNLFLRALTSELAHYGANEFVLENLSESPEKTKNVAHFVHKYLQVRYKTQQFPPWFEKLLAEMSEGTPLFLVEALIDFEEKGRMKKIVADQGDQEWTFPFEYVRFFPEKVEDIFRKRIKRLKAPFPEILEYASVQGNRFLFETIPFLHREQRPDILQELKTRAFLQAEEESRLVNGTPVRIGTFGHPSLRDYLYQQLSSEKKQRLHANTGKVLERLYKPYINEIISDLAIHFYYGARPDKAVIYCLQASEEANTRYGTPEAIRFAVMGLKSLKEGGDIFSEKAYAEYQWRLLLALARAEEHAADRDVEDEHLRIGTAYLEDHLPLVDVTKDDLHAEVYTQLGRLYARQEEHLQAREYLEKALYIYEQQEAKPRVADVLYQLAGVYPLGESFQMLERSLALAEQSDDAAMQLKCLHRLVERYAEIDFPCAESYARQAWELAKHDKAPKKFWNISILIMMASICRENGQFQAGFRHLEDALDVARYRGDLLLEAAILNDLGFDYGRYVSRQEEARKTLKESLAIRERAGLDKSAPLYNLGWLLTRKGLWQEAETRFQQAIVASSERNQPWYRGGIGYLYELRENYAQAEMELLYRISVVDAAERSQNVFGYTGIALSYALSGEKDQSRQYLERARELFEEETRPRKRWWCLYEMAEVYRLLGENHTAKTSCQSAIDWFCEQAEQAEDLIDLAKARFVMGKILVDSDSCQQALPYLKQAETAFEQCQHYMLGDVWFSLGKAYAKSGDDRAAAYINQALAEFRRLELHHKEAEAKAVLATLQDK